MKTIKLPIFDIEIVLDNGSGTITSNLHADNMDDTPFNRVAMFYNAQIDALESLILAHACEGIDVSHESYLNGIQTVVDKIQNDLV